MADVHVEGLEDVLFALSELPKATSTNVLKRALTNAADPIQAEAERLAPHLSGALQRSITVGTKLSRSQRAKYTKVNKVEIFVGPGALAQATLQEFGSVHNRPQPFLRPAWSDNWRKALDSIAGELTDEIEKARVRLARKAARLLAKMK